MNNAGDPLHASGSSRRTARSVAENLLTSVIANVVIAIVINPLIGILWYHFIRPDVPSAVTIALILWVAWITTTTRLILARTKQQRQDHSSPSCCALLESGFLAVHSDGHETILSSVVEAKTTFRFLGVSAQFPLELTDKRTGEYVFRGILMDKVRQGVVFRFLLLDPNAKDWVAEHAKREHIGPGDPDPDSLERRLSLHLDTLRTLQAQAEKENARGRIDIKTYQDLPSFRLAIVDDTKVYASFYGGAHFGVDVPQYVFANGDKSFFSGYSAFFENAWLNPMRKRSRSSKARRKHNT